MKKEIKMASRNNAESQTTLKNINQAEANRLSLGPYTANRSIFSIDPANENWRSSIKAIIANALEASVTDYRIFLLLIAVHVSIFHLSKFIFYVALLAAFCGG